MFSFRVKSTGWSKPSATISFFEFDGSMFYRCIFKDWILYHDDSLVLLSYLHNLKNTLGFKIINIREKIISVQKGDLFMNDIQIFYTWTLRLISVKLTVLPTNLHLYLRFSINIADILLFFHWSLPAFLNLFTDWIKLIIELSFWF